MFIDMYRDTIRLCVYVWGIGSFTRDLYCISERSFSFIHLMIQISELVNLPQVVSRIIYSILFQSLVSGFKWNKNSLRMSMTCHGIFVNEFYVVFSSRVSYSCYLCLYGNYFIFSGLNIKDFPCLSEEKSPLHFTCSWEKSTCPDNKSHIHYQYLGFSCLCEDKSL